MCINSYFIRLNNTSTIYRKSIFLYLTNTKFFKRISLNVYDIIIFKRIEDFIKSKNKSKSHLSLLIIGIDNFKK